MTNVVRLRPPKHREYDPRRLDNVIADPRYIFSRPSGRRRASLLARLAAVLRRAFSKLLASR
jgi:hypothetical protein